MFGGLYFICAKKVTSFKASLLPEFLSELFEAFDLSHCSESKLFNTFKKLTVKIGVRKLLRCGSEQFRCFLGVVFSQPTKLVSIFLQ